MRVPITKLLSDLMADFNYIKRKERRSLLEKVVLQHSLLLG
jgi:hypothetical protein